MHLFGTLALLFCGCTHQTPAPAPAAAGEPTADKRIAAALLREDLRQLVSILESSHPDPFLRGGGRVAFARRVDEVMAAIPAEGATTEAFRILLRPIVASVRDGHTQLAGSPSTGVGGLWLDLEPVERELFVSGVYQASEEPLLGGRLLAVGGVDLAELLRRMGDLRGYDNEMHNLVNLTRALRDSATLAALVGPVGESVLVRVATADGEIEAALAPASAAGGERIAMPSALSLPEAGPADIAWTLLEGTDAAYLRIDSMMRYREAFELWRAMGFEGNLGAHLDAVAQAAGADPLPAERDARIAAVPSATETFAALFDAMQAAQTRALIVDVRANGGGNSAMSAILAWFLLPAADLAALDDGYQVRRFSQLFFDKNTQASVADLRSRGLEVGDLDFSEERTYRIRAEQGLTEPERAEQLAGMSQMVGAMPSFQLAWEAGTHNAAYVPETVIVVTSGRTYSAGFDLARLLHRTGATLVGVPSAQAGNCFIDSLPFALSHSGIEGSLSSKYSVAFPDDPAAGEMLVPQIVLTAERFAELRFDPNASIRLALEALAKDRKPSP